MMVPRMWHAHVRQRVRCLALALLGTNEPKQLGYLQPGHLWPSDIAGSQAEKVHPGNVDILLNG